MPDCQSCQFYEVIESEELGGLEYCAFKDGEIGYTDDCHVGEILEG